MAKKEQIQFHYIKSNFFRVIYADGVWGGLTPQGNIQFSVFSERAAIPQKIVHELHGDGTVGEELEEERESRGGIVREVEADIVMSVDSAKKLAEWLRGKIELMERLKKSK